MEQTAAAREEAFGSITAAQSAALDAAAEGLGVHVDTLMRIAGWQVARCAWQRIGAAAAVLVCAGNGNNGGDALVAAQYLAAWGCQVHLDTCATAHARSALWTALHAELTPMCASASDLDTEHAAHHVAGQVEGVSLVVDGLLGTGTQGAPRGVAREVITALCAQRVPVLAVDIPSGFDADTGATADVCVAAEATCTLAAVKRGLWTALAAGRGTDRTDGAPPTAGPVGSLWAADIGMPAAAWESIGLPAPAALRGGALAEVFG